jgi:hypothetical protein
MSGYRPLVHGKAINDDDRKLRSATSGRKPVRHVPRHLVNHDGPREKRKAVQ